MNRTIIVVESRWVFTGYITGEDPEKTLLTEAACIRRWGTTRGLGQLALAGPTSETVLDACGDLTIQTPQILFRMNCPGWK